MTKEEADNLKPYDCVVPLGGEHKGEIGHFLAIEIDAGGMFLSVKFGDNSIGWYRLRELSIHETGA